MWKTSTFSEPLQDNSLCSPGQSLLAFCSCIWCPEAPPGQNGHKTLVTIPSVNNYQKNLHKQNTYVKTEMKRQWYFKIMTCHLRDICKNLVERRYV